MHINKCPFIEDSVRKKPQKMSFEEFMAMMAASGKEMPKHDDMPRQEKVIPVEERASIEIENGELHKDPSAIFGGTIDSTRGNRLRIVGYGAETGGIWLSGKDTNFLLEDSYIYMDGDSPVHNNAGGGKYNPVYVDDHAKMTIRNSILYANGCERHALGCDKGAELRVYDSIISSHGAAYGKNLPNGYTDRTVTKGHILAGNTRATSAGGDTKSYYYNSTITAEGWGALATDGGGDGIYLEANDCRIITSKSGYGTYADGGCHNVFNRCVFNCACMSVILSGESKAEFHSCRSNNGTHFAVIYCVISPSDAETAELTIEDCNIDTIDSALLVKSANALVRVKGSSIHSDAGTIVESVVSDDKDATKVTSDRVYGVNVYFEECDLIGNLVNTDTDRSMYVHLSDTTLVGAAENVVLYLEDNAHWIADGDSEVYLGKETDIDCIDAMPGVTILAHGDAEYETVLPSGGKLQVVCD